MSPYNSFYQLVTRLNEVRANVAKSLKQVKKRLSQYELRNRFNKFLSHWNK